jgi:Rrf2 family protein
MRLERATAYGLLALAYMAKQDATVLQQVHVISKETGVPATYLQKIMSRLARQRIITGTRGRSGGFKLAKLPKNITMLNIVEAIEGPMDPASVLNDDMVSGRDATSRRLQKWRQRLVTRLRTMLEETTLGDITG